MSQQWEGQEVYRAVVVRSVLGSSSLGTCVCLSLRYLYLILEIYVQKQSLKVWEGKAKGTLDVASSPLAPLCEQPCSTALSLPWCSATPQAQPDQVRQPPPEPLKPWTQINVLLLYCLPHLFCHGKWKLTKTTDWSGCPRIKSFSLCVLLRLIRQRTWCSQIHLNPNMPNVLLETNLSLLFVPLKSLQHFVKAWQLALSEMAWSFSFISVNHKAPIGR